MDRAKTSALVSEVFDTWAPSLVRHARHLTGSRESAEDLIQEAFLALYRELRAGKSIENPRAWTLTVVRYCAAKRLRDQARHGECLQPNEVFDGLPGGSPPSGDEDMDRYLSILTEREQEVILLRMECLKYREIGEQLGINDKTVATLLARALRKLKAAFSQASRQRAATFQESNVSKALQ